MAAGAACCYRPAAAGRASLDAFATSSPSLRPSSSGVFFISSSSSRWWMRRRRGEGKVKISSSSRARAKPMSRPALFSPVAMEWQECRCVSDLLPFSLFLLDWAHFLNPCQRWCSRLRKEFYFISIIFGSWLGLFCFLIDVIRKQNLKRGMASWCRMNLRFGLRLLLGWNIVELILIRIFHADSNGQWCLVESWFMTEISHF